MHELGEGTCNEETRGMEGTWKASPAIEEAEEKEEVMDSRNILRFRATVPWWSAVVGVKERNDLGDYLMSGLNTWVEGYFSLEQCNYEDTGGMDLFYAPGRYIES